MGEVLVPALIEAFGLRNGYRVERRITDDTHFSYILTDSATDRVAARIRFKVTSTAEGFADLLADEADIVLSTRQVTRQEIQLAEDAGLGDLSNPRRSRVVALDALVPVVGSQNPLTGLTINELQQVFSGQITNWARLGGPDAPISLHLRDRLSGLTQEFRSRVLLPFQTDLAENVTFHASTADLTEAVARDPLAIGISVLSELGNAKLLMLTGTCGKPVIATALSVKTEDYPLTMPLFIYTPARRLSVFAREFLAYSRSALAQPVIERAGFVDLRMREIPVADQGQRLANAIATAGGETSIEELQRMVKRMDGTARLSLSFRFESGGTRLDAQSRSNVEILAQYIERGDFDGRMLIFAGFTDGDGPAEGNLRLARRRAEAVRRAVLRAAPTADRDRLNLTVDAFGEAMPMACDDTEWGRFINRRVEVWVDQR